MGAIYGSDGAEKAGLSLGLKEAVARLKCAMNDWTPSFDDPDFPAFCVIGEVLSCLEVLEQEAWELADHAWPEVHIAPGLHEKLVEHCKKGLGDDDEFPIGSATHAFVNVAVLDAIKAKVSPKSAIRAHGSICKTLGSRSWAAPRERKFARVLESLLCDVYSSLCDDEKIDPAQATKLVDEFKETVAKHRGKEKGDPAAPEQRPGRKGKKRTEGKPSVQRGRRQRAS